jgi:hypothetical protein
MISSGDNIHSAQKQLLGQPRRDSQAAGGILAIGHHQVQAQFTPQVLNHALHAGTARRPEDISYHENAHHKIIGMWGTFFEKRFPHAPSKILYGKLLRNLFKLYVGQVRPAPLSKL